MASHAATAGLGTPRHMLGEASSMAATLEAEDGAEEEDEYEEDFEVDEATTEEECAGADADADAFSAFGGTLPSTLPGAAGARPISESQSRGSFASVLAAERGELAATVGNGGEERCEEVPDESPDARGGMRASSHFGSFAAGAAPMPSTSELEETLRQLRIESSEREIVSDELEVLSGTLKAVEAALPQPKIQRQFTDPAEVAKYDALIDGW